MFWAHRHEEDINQLIERTLGAPHVAAAPVEQYRALALSLERTEPRGQHRAVVISSALPGEGKTLTATNLAYTLSRSYRRRVLLIDGDLRRPRLHAVLAGTGAPAARLPQDDVPPMAAALNLEMTRLGPSFYLLGSREKHDADPVKTLNSPDTEALFAWARERFEWVLVDSSPAALVPDATILSQFVDGIVFVVLVGRTPHDAVRLAVSTLGQDRILGVVMNQVRIDTDRSAWKYYDAYADDYQQEPGRAEKLGMS